MTLLRIFQALLFVFAGQLVTGQVFVQLELFNEPETKKFYIGDQITYKTKYYSEAWQKGTLKQILIEENTLVLHNEILPIDQVSQVMLYRPGVNILGRLLESFGTLWLGYGTVLKIFQRPSASWGNILGVGGGTLIGGIGLRKLFYKIPVKVGNQNRLRIIDTRFSID